MGIHTYMYQFIWWNYIAIYPKLNILHGIVNAWHNCMCILPQYNRIKTNSLCKFSPLGLY